MSRVPKNNKHQVTSAADPADENSNDVSADGGDVSSSNNNNNKSGKRVETEQEKAVKAEAKKAFDKAEAEAFAKRKGKFDKEEEFGDDAETAIHLRKMKELAPNLYLQLKSGFKTAKNWRLVNCFMFLTDSPVMPPKPDYPEFEKDGKEMVTKKPAQWGFPKYTGKRVTKVLLWFRGIFEKIEPDGFGSMKVTVIPIDVEDKEGGLALDDRMIDLWDENQPYYDGCRIIEAPVSKSKKSTSAAAAAVAPPPSDQKPACHRTEYSHVMKLGGLGDDSKEEARDHLHTDIPRWPDRVSAKLANDFKTGEPKHKFVDVDAETELKSSDFKPGNVVDFAFAFTAMGYNTKNNSLNCYCALLQKTDEPDMPIPAPRSIQSKKSKFPEMQKKKPGGVSGIVLGKSKPAVSTASAVSSQQQLPLPLPSIPENATTSTASAVWGPEQLQKLKEQAVHTTAPVAAQPIAVVAQQLHAAMQQAINNGQLSAVVPAPSSVAPVVAQQPPIVSVPVVSVAPVVSVPVVTATPVVSVPVVAQQPPSVTPVVAVVAPPVITPPVAQQPIAVMVPAPVVAQQPVTPVVETVSVPVVVPTPTPVVAQQPIVHIPVAPVVSVPLAEVVPPVAAPIAPIVVPVQQVASSAPEVSTVNTVAPVNSSPVQSSSVSVVSLASSIPPLEAVTTPAPTAPVAVVEQPTVSTAVAMQA